MKITKEELAKIAEKNGLDKDYLEKLLSENGKKLSHCLIDVLGLVVKKTKNELDDAGFEWAEDKMRELADKVEVSL